MKKKNFKRKDKYDLTPIVNKYKKGGFVLMDKDNKTVLVYGKDIEKLYKKMNREKIKHDEQKTVMYVPPKNTVCIFHFLTPSLQ